MANRIKINRGVRKVHFVASTFIFAFALLFVFSGMVISKGNWFKHKQGEKSTSVYPLNYTPDTTRVKQFGNEIKQQFDISGRMSYRRNWKKELVFTYNRPMVINAVTVYPALDSVSIVCTKKISFFEANKRIHRVHGFQGGILYIAWAVLLDITAISMIAFAITGILIWFQWRKQLFYGLFILISTTTLLIVMFVFLK